MIGLAGTILVTGIAPVMVVELGASAVPVILVITLSGWLLCLFLAELSAMMPDRSGGSPAYAYVAYKDRWPRFAEHINGITAWGYWLGWFPVAPLNMILASFYIADLFNLNTSSGISPARDADRLVDDRDLGRRHRAAVHPGLPRACASGRSSRPRSRSSR